MVAPVGGDCGGMTARAGCTLAEEGLTAATNLCTIANGVEPAKFGVQMAGTVLVAVQQSLWIEALDSDAPAQQSCAALWDRCWQIPDGATRVPISKMATAARWRKPCNMNLAYQCTQFLR